MWGERDPTKLDFVGLALRTDGLNKNISSVLIFRNFPFFSGILFLSFWVVFFSATFFFLLEYLLLGELFPWLVSSMLLVFIRFLPLFLGFLLLDGLALGCLI